MRFAFAAVLLFASACSSSGAETDADEAVVRIVDAGLHNPVVRDAQLVEQPSAAHEIAHSAIVRLRGESFEVEAPIDAGASEERR
jgi:hypothetical protein